MKKIYLIGSKHKTNDFGIIIILKELPERRVLVQFKNTGSEKVCHTANIGSGRIKDNLAPIYYGVGFIGDGIHRSMTNYKPNNAHRVWRNMLQRCYCPSSAIKYPTYKNVTVCSGWHNFQNFAEWFYMFYTENSHIDKDILCNGDKIYSPDTCLFVSPSVNQEAAIAKHYLIRSPNGTLHYVYNLSKFCKENNLGDYSALRRAATGEKAHHKGWAKA